ncbi:MAG: hypothetical protein R6W70_06470 [bacterium]
MIDNSETRKMIRDILWDSEKTVDEVMFILAQKNESDEKRRFIARLLKSFNWYKLMKLFSQEELKKIVADELIIRSIFPQSLREKYKHVREILH